jgi:hypothetical protein
MGKFVKGSQIEVWKMKEALYERVKDLSLENAINQMLVNAHKTVENLSKKGKLSSLLKDTP